MDAGLVVAIVFGVAFAVTNGFHDASNSIAALVATRVATPLQAIVLASVFNLLGPLLVGAAVANTIGGIVSVTPAAANRVIGAALAAAVAWNLATWSRGLPSSSVQALVGGLVGAALAEGGADAVNWGGVHSGHPVGVVGTLISLAISPPLGALGALLVIRLLRRLGRRATRRWDAPVRGGQWATAAWLSFSHGANDAQKSVGVIAALLFASGKTSSLAAPTWVVVVCAAALTAGTALGDGGSFAPWAAGSIASSKSRAWRQPVLRQRSSSLRRWWGRRRPPLRLSPRRSWVSAEVVGAGVTFTGRSSARWASLG